MTSTDNSRQADHPVERQFLDRWSPRAFTAETISDAELMRLFEAARWAPSSFNVQPWRFVYAHRDTDDWAPLFDLLNVSNKVWAARASVLAFIFADRFRRTPEGAVEPNYSHAFDAGAAWAYLALQAHKQGLAAHGLVGFDHAQAYATLGVPEDQYWVAAGIAIGRAGDKNILPDVLRAREAPNGRNPVSSFAFKGRFAL